MAGYMGLAAGAYATIEAKTASYRMVRTDHGKIFTTRGAGGAITFTLPVTADIDTGWTVTCYNIADQNMIVQSATSDTIITLNDATADSVAYQTASEKIGGGFTFVWDGTGWMTFTHAEETQTVTVVTA